MRAMHHFKIRVIVVGPVVKVELEHYKYTAGPYSESVCQTATIVIEVPGQDFHMTLDGSALISQNAIMSRLP